MTNKTNVTAPADKPVIHIERWFDAPRHLVWKATTTPDLVKRWWAPPCTELVSCEMDVRVGGSWRIVLKSEHGVAGFHGEYRELAAPSRLVRTDIYEAFPDAVAIETATLVDEGPRTKLVLEIVHPNIASRDAHLASGMENGMGMAHDQLDALVQALA
jgi:uncharacterized protein YndB with AHSA1/START domain